MILSAHREGLTLKEQIALKDIENAAERISTIARRTPLERSRWLSDRARDVSLKLECFQATGSFKLRGATARLSRLTEDEKARGVLTVSAGNHGLGVALCAEALGIPATIVVPLSASRAKVEALRRYPVTLIERGAGYDEAEREARKLEHEDGAIFVSPYNDPEVIAGQGTIGLEILQDDPQIDAIIVPVGGGGLIAGILIAAKAIKPDVKVYGVEPLASPTMTRSLEAGSLVEIEEDETIADGLAGNIEPGSITFPIVQRLIDDIILVSEDSIRESIRRVASEDHIMIEGSSAAAVAALDDARITGRRIAAVITGRNISLDLFKSVMRDP